jgi:hypothetical protein
MSRLLKCTEAVCNAFPLLSLEGELALTRNISTVMSASASSISTLIESGRSATIWGGDSGCGGDEGTPLVGDTAETDSRANNITIIRI